MISKPTQVNCPSRNYSEWEKTSRLICQDIKNRVIFNFKTRWKLTSVFIFVKFCI